MTEELFVDIPDETLSKIVWIENVKEFDSSKIENGIISIHSKWSGHSILNGKLILKCIENIKNPDFKIFLIDNETINNEESLKTIGMISHGYFESVWIEKGKIKFGFKGNQNSDELNDFLNKIGQNAK